MRFKHISATMESESKPTAGYQISHPPPGDEVCITGLSGSFPDSDSVFHLKENLFNKVDLVSGDSRRWKMTHPDIPQRTGKINNLEKFDASYFGLNYKEAHTMDPMSRIILERTYEAIIDAGFNPEELRNTKTGVFVGCSISESEKTWVYDKLHVNNYGITGCSKTMIANCISIWLGVQGPSFSLDTACSSSLYAFELAFKSIRSGKCDAAIVGGANLCLHPHMSLQFSKMGILSPDGRSKSFDNSGNGYARSETVGVCFLQKAKDSRKVYTQVIHAKTNCDGYKEQGISYPSGDMQKVLLEDIYEECGILPTSIEYIEAHGTGTTVGDREELQAIEDVMCTGRTEPLLIGSVKSNLGHSEPGSGICAIAKLCIAYSTGYIPPNLHYKVPKKGIAALVDGRLKVVTEAQPWGRGLSCINNFGFGGANAHVIFKNYEKTKVNNGLPADDLPRLVCVSGRVNSSVARILDDMESRTVDIELIRLLHEIHKNNIKGHFYRGYTLLGSTPTKSVSLARSTQYFSGIRRPVCFLYSGIVQESQWTRIASELMRKIPVFASAIERCHETLRPKGINLKQMINEPDSKVYNNVLNSSIGAAVVQIGLTDILKALRIDPEFCLGDSVSELGCAYGDGRFTIEQMILAAYALGLKATENPFTKGCIATPTVDSLGYSESSVSFEESVRLIPVNAIAIEIGPDGVLQDFLNCLSEKNAVHVPLTNRTHPDIVQVLFTALGKLYEAGLNPHLVNVYPVVEFPVSQGTPMLAHLVEWQHNEDWSVFSYKIMNDTLLNERTVNISIADEENTYMVGHVIDGRNLFPATSYLVMVWETLGMIMGQLYTELSVVFEDVRFHRSTNIPKNGQLEFIVSIQKGSGCFEIVESMTSIVTGRIRVKKNVGQEFRLIPFEPESTGPNVKHMLTKDFYKETRLRGYQYSGLFQGVLGCNVEGTRGRLAWINEWVTFLDCMLQMRLIGNDTRGLHVPTRIEKLSIDVNMHNDAIAKMNIEYLRHSFEVRVYPYADVIRAGGVEIRGLHTTPIQKKVSLITPVLEKNIFIPNFGKSTMRIEDILRSNIQLILENIHTYKVKCIEIIDDEYTTKGFEPIMKKVADVLNDLPLIQDDLYVVSKNPIEMPPFINVLNRQQSGKTNAVLLIGANLLERPKILKEALLSLRNEGFIVSREIRPINAKDFSNEYDIIGIQNTSSEYIVLFRKRIAPKPTNFIKIVTSDETYKWIDKVKEGLAVGEKLVIYSQDDQVNGLLGLVNCLRREPGGEKIRGLLIADPTAPPFDPDLEFYKKQLDMDLAINVYYEGHWGTYRHLLLNDLETVRAHHAFVKTAHIGDLSSQQWLEGPIKENQFFTKSNFIHIDVYCAALNFRDVMIASGRIAVDAVTHDRLVQEYMLGMEVVGRTRNGTRVMAIVDNKGLSNVVEADRRVVSFIPDEWTFEEAATVPLAYGTAYHALVMVGKIQKGESILIHAGSGGVGQAAINVALHYGAEVFTTVGTQEKRDFIKRLFPQLKDSHIGNSRDTSFEAMIKEQTNGKGVNLVLNSLSDEKLQASIRCLVYGGRFLEIGKFDVNNNTLIDMNFFRNEISFHGIMFDLNMHDTEFAKTIRDLLVSGIETGAVRPLTYCTFEKDEMEKAFRYMAAGKHIGKIVFKIRDEECEDNTDFTKPLIQYIDAVPRYNCDPDLVYIIVGGLGGFGLELADWLILREARKLLLASRKGVSNGYQSLRLRTWASYGAEMQISTHDITTEKGCEEMLKKANSMGTVAAIFNLAVVLEDRIFQNQTPESFKVSFAPKALVTMNLDKLSQKLCPKLKDFVIFSSVSCGRGNAGQSNYGFSNSVMERICERRKKLGLPALAIQWGAIGDVGLVADMKDDDIEMEIGGTLQQRISSCLLTLDKLLRQDNVIVSSMVVAQKKTSDEGDNIAGIVGQILGIKDVKTVSNQVSLADFGMDSITAVEIKQILEREYEIFLTPDGIRSLTFAKLIELTTQSETDDSRTKPVSLASSEDSAALHVLIRNFGDEKLAEELFTYLPTMTNDGSDNLSLNQENEMIMFVLPGVEGCASGMANLCRQLKIKVCVLQYCYDEKDDTLDKLVENLFQTIKERLNAGRPYILLGYSFGTLLVLKLAQILESEGHSGRVFCIDGSPEFLKVVTMSNFSFKNDTELQNRLICYTIDLVAPRNKVTNTLMDKLKDIESYDERIKYGIKACPAQKIYSDKFVESVAKAFYNRAKIVLSRNEIKKIKAPIVLIRPKENSYNALKENYGLDGFTDSYVTVHLLEENHITIIDSKECANIINSNLSAQGGEKA
ncbi:fatty acid synthase-like [Melitaea cinxia]|uniref:fatty acid synthase-like n=1 Tax=Melitaea cinxia TaxID=113334 RepID=UPI001E2702B4|nr:fatty acid synthase-like [Melitaea cinxia]